LSQDRQDQLSSAKQGYATAQKTIDQMVKLGIIIGGPPIKKQTLGEKRKIVKNFDQLTDVYNRWAEQNSDMYLPITDYIIESDINRESNFWHNFSSTVAIANK
jgi:hypothetical protein